MAESRDSQQVEGSFVAIAHPAFAVDYCHSRLYMVQHLAIVSLLGHDFVSLLVEYVPEPVEGLVESAADDAAFVKSEVQLLVLQGIQHVCDLLPHPSGCQNG